MIRLAGRRTDRERTGGRPLVLVGVIAAVVVVADQLTKTLALARLGAGPVHVFWTLQLDLSFNSGLAFGQGRGLTPVITVGAIVLVGVLILVSRGVRGTAQAVALGLLIGGACGNLADRLFRGHDGAVVDFIDLQWWPVFNLADAAITCGALLLMLVTIREPASR